jgi:hypothetical protein
MTKHFARGVAFSAPITPLVRRDRNIEGELWKRVTRGTPVLPCARAVKLSPLWIVCNEPWL